MPAEINDFTRYFANYGPINFNIEEKKDGTFVAVSTDFKYGSIITSAKNMKKLDEEIKDAILTAFEIPSAFANEAKVIQEGSRELRYATVK